MAHNMHAEPSFRQAREERWTLSRRDVRLGAEWARWLYYLILVEFVAAPILTLVHDTYRTEVASFSLPQLIRGLLLGAIVLCLTQVSIPARWGLQLFVPVLLMALYSAVLTVVAAAPKENAIATFRMVYPCLVGIAAYIVLCCGFLSEAAIQRLGWYWLLSYFISQLLALRTGQMAYKSEHAAAGLGSSPSAADGLILLVPFFLLARRWRPRDLLAIGIALLAASLTMRRTAMLGVLAATLAGAMVRALRRGSGFRAKLAGVLLPAAIYFGFTYALTTTGWGTDFSKRLADMDLRQAGTGAGRTVVWQSGIDHLLHRGLLRNIVGEGEGGYAEAMVRRIGFSVAAHNGWLTLAAAYGLIGLVLYLTFLRRLGSIMLRARRLNDSTFEVLVSVLAGIVCAEATQGFLLSPSAVPTYVLLGLVLAKNSRAVLRRSAQSMARTATFRGLMQADLKRPAG